MAKPCGFKVSLIMIVLMYVYIGFIERFIPQENLSWFSKRRRIVFPMDANLLINTSV